MFFGFIFSVLLFALIYFFSLFFDPFLSINISLFCRGAVFALATAFNGDLSAWDVGKVETMAHSTFTFFSHLHFLNLHCWYIFRTLLFFLFKIIFIIWLFFLFMHCGAAVVQCLFLLMHSTVISTHGTSGKWGPWVTCFSGRMHSIVISLHGKSGKWGTWT